MSPLVSRTFNQIAAHDYASHTTPAQARTDAENLRQNVYATGQRVNELNRLDRKWNGGYASGETVGARNGLSGLQQRSDVMRTYFQDQMESSNTFPSQKEYAQQSLRRLDGR